MTALYVTHDQAEAVVLGDRIGVMRDGKLLQMGTPDEIYNRPADLFVANFTGATNETRRAPCSSATASSAWSISAAAIASRRRCVHGIGPGREGAHRVAAGKYRARRA